MDDYLKLLEKARKGLPASATVSERFEIPAANVQIGRQTVLKNFSDIVKALRRDAKHLAKFLFKELAVPGSMRQDELLLQGRIPGSMVNKRIEEYAKEFVFCNECGKPDTKMLKEGRILLLKCEACGARRSVRAV
ncbi:MAG: translation initiation factor IF-2 subunit beta [Candidatus Aenigmarchaeota archaeon]|nr:translation initiation factor IF-2 subunit beta [Candidatus Aenigmarchaeota archaeon]